MVESIVFVLTSAIVKGLWAILGIYRITIDAFFYMGL